MICQLANPRCFVNGNLFSRYHSHLKEALEFIDSVQRPTGQISNCSDIKAAANDINRERYKYALMNFGVHGGFAAQFQLAASEWMRMFAGAKFSVPIVITGRIIGYSDSDACAAAKHEWTCYFQPAVDCQDQLLKYGQPIPYPNFGGRPDELAVPKQFRDRGLGLPFW